MFLPVVFFMLSGVVSAPTPDSDLPPWFTKLNPEARVKLYWREVYETGEDSSGPELLARGGLFPHFVEIIETGIEISTIDTQIGSSPESISLSNGSGGKPLSLTQAFVGVRWEPSSFEALALLGKFASPLLVSPLIWDSEIRPEGALQSLSFNPGHSALRFAVFAGQFSLNQVSSSVVAGTSKKNSWLFTEGILGAYRLGAGYEIRLGVNSHYFLHPSTSLADISGPRGNALVGTVGSSPRFRFEYAPVEFVARAQTKPLGITAALEGAFVVNFRTPDQQRAFWIEGQLGNPWKKQNLFFTASYYYNEPDVTLAMFTSRQYAYANRKGPRLELSYYLFDFMRIGSSFLFVETLAGSAFQSTHKEWRGDVEMRF